MLTIYGDYWTPVALWVYLYVLLAIWYTRTERFPNATMTWPIDMESTPNQPLNLSQATPARLRGSRTNLVFEWIHKVINRAVPARLSDEDLDKLDLKLKQAQTKMNESTTELLEKLDATELRTDSECSKAKR